MKTLVAALDAELNNHAPHSCTAECAENMWASFANALGAFRASSLADDAVLVGVATASIAKERRSKGLREMASESIALAILRAIDAHLKGDK